MERQDEAIVVGAGLAGLACAIRLAERGVPHRLLEAREEDCYPCNTRYSGGVFQIAFRSVESDPAELARAIRESTGGFVEPDLARSFADGAGDGMAWLAGQGIGFGRIEPTEGWRDRILLPLGYHDRPGLAWRDSGADVMMRRLEDRLVALGSRIERGVRAEGLDVEDRVRGIATSAGRFPAGAVVLADGGFQGSPDLLRRFVTPHPGRICHRGPGTSPGDGVRMAEAAGADLLGMDTFYGHLLSADAIRNSDLWPFPFIDFLASAGILLDRRAERFVDEGRGGVFMANAVARHDAADPAVAVFDEAIWQEAGRVFFAPPNPWLPKSGGTLHVAADLDELASRAGLPADALRASVGRHNQGVNAASWADRGTERTDPKGTARPIRTPPFYAAPCCVGMTHTMGGIRVDSDARALRPDGSPIDGLYAAGNSAGGLEGGPRRIYIGGLAKALVFGLKAADQVAARLPAARA